MQNRLLNTHFLAVIRQTLLLVKIAVYSPSVTFQLSVLWKKTATVHFTGQADEAHCSVWATLHLARYRTSVCDMWLVIGINVMKR